MPVFKADIRLIREDMVTLTEGGSSIFALFPTQRKDIHFFLK